MAFEDETQVEDEKSFWDYIAEYWFLIVAGLLLLILRNRWGIVGPWDRATFAAGALVFVGFFVKFMWDAWKNSSAKVVYNYGHSTTDGETFTAGNFFVVQRAIKAGGVYWKLSGAYIFPLDSFRKIGPNISTSARMERVKIDEIPLGPKTILLHRNIKEPYYLGFADEEQYIDTVDDPKKISGKENPSVSYLITMIRELTKENAFLRKLKGEKMKDLEDLAEWGTRLKKKDSTTDKIRRTLMEEEK